MLCHLSDGGLGEFAVCLDKHLTGLWVDNVYRCLLVGKKLRVSKLLDTVPLKKNLLAPVVVVEEVFGGIAESLEENRCRHLPAAVDTDEKDVLVIELEIKPRPTVRDNPGGVENLTA
jgi:hypothetical protein